MFAPLNKPQHIRELRIDEVKHMKQEQVADQQSIPCKVGNVLNQLEEIHHPLVIEIRSHIYRRG